MWNISPNSTGAIRTHSIGLSRSPWSAICLPCRNGAGPIRTDKRDILSVAALPISVTAPQVAGERFELSARLVLSESGLPIAYPATSTPGRSCTYTVHVLSVATPAIGLRGRIEPGAESFELGENANTARSVLGAPVLPSAAYRFRPDTFCSTDRCAKPLHQCGKYPIKESNRELHGVNVTRCHFTNRAQR